MRTQGLTMKTLLRTIRNYALFLPMGVLGAIMVSIALKYLDENANMNFDRK